MPRAFLAISWTIVLLLASVAVGCGGNGSVPDAGGPMFPGRPDGAALPDYREPGCGGDGGAASGLGCDGAVVSADGGVSVDAPAEPPCNLVTFLFIDPAPRTVWVSGTFNDWAETPAEGAIELRAEGGGRFVGEALIEPVGRHEYKLVVDGTRWIADPANPEGVSDGFGAMNSVLRVCEASCGDVEAFDWRDAVMYFALTDRFVDADGVAMGVAGASDGDAARGPSAQYEGGDLEGLTSRVPYLADLGVSALWISAPYDNRDGAGAAIDPSDPHLYSGYHGYWPAPAAIDYAGATPAPRPRVEPRIGTEDDLRALVGAAHAAETPAGDGIRVLFDYVMKHVDVDSGLYAAHPDWFARRDGRFVLCGPENLWDDPYWGTRCAFTDYLPPFDFENAAARAWSVSDALHWAKEFGIDGYRLDAIKHVPLVWLEDLRARLTAEITPPAGQRFYLVGETFAYDDRELLRRFVDPATKLDGQFDFPLKARLCEAAFRPEGSFEDLAAYVADNDRFYGQDAIMTTWIGNHDIPRAIHFASGEITSCREGSHAGNGWTMSYPQPTDPAAYERLGVAFAFLLTSPGIPLIYYGDEVGLAGGGDPDNRRMMPAEDALLPAQRSLRDGVRALARLRGQHPVIGRGQRTTISVTRDTWLYRLAGCGLTSVVVALNRADEPRQLDLPAGTYTDLVNGGAASAGAITLAPRSFRAFEAR